MRKTNVTLRKRLTLVFILTGIFFFCLVGRLAWVQFVQGQELQYKALEVRLRDIPVEAKRGSIFDRNGKEMVTSISVDSIYATPRQVKDPQGTAQKLAAILDQDADQLYERLTKASSFEWIKRKAENDVVRQIRDLDLPGIGFVEESKRYYLDSAIAAHVLGFTGVDNQGLAGLEKSYDDELRGKPGRIVLEHDAAGRPVPEAMHKYIAPQQGYDLVLTIDEVIQYFVERELDKLMAQCEPKFALVLIMDPKTGDILAMGNRPTFNPNKWQDEPREVWDKNPAIWYNYEPGSTFKIITAAAALEEGSVQPGDSFFDPGYSKVADRIIKCWKDGGHGNQTFLEVMQNSCNPGFITVGLNTGTDRLYKYIDAFGFGDITGVSLPGEAGGIVIPAKKVTTLNLATISMGQSIAVTPIQLVTAISAVANDGVLMKPRLVKEIKSDQKTVTAIKPEKVRQVISKETANQLCLMLETVVVDGTGTNAYVDGFRVGGKTGTAQVVGERGGYVSGRYVASFAGIAPVDDPQIVMLVVVAEPTGGVYFGGQLAAPVFKAVAKDTLRYLGVQETPDLKKPMQPWEVETPLVEVTVPGVVNQPLAEAQATLQKAGLKIQTRGEGQTVYGQMPGAGARVESGTTVILEMVPSQTKKTGAKVTVPDLKGLTIKEAGIMLEQIDLRLLPRGSGLAVKQDVKPGSKVAAGKVITVTFAPPQEDSP